MMPFEARDLVLDLEAGFPVNEWKFDGLRVWPLIRTTLLYHVMTAQGGRAESGGSLGRLGLLAQAWFGRLRDRSHEDSTGPADLFFLSPAVSRTARLREGYFDTLLGPIQEAARFRGLRTLMWETSHPFPYRLPRGTSSVRVQDRLYGVLARHALRPLAPGSTALAGYDGFQARLASKGIFLEALKSEVLQREIGHLVRLRDLFGAALDRVRPKLAFTSNFSRYEMALHWAAAQRGLPSVEVQHGFQGEQHPQYASWSVVPPEGYELLPSRYWCWTESEVRVISGWSNRCAPRHQAFAGGNPWHAYAAGLPSDSLLPEDAERLQAVGSRKMILVSLSIPGLTYPEADFLHPPVLEAMSALGPELCWWIRPHPRTRTLPSSFLAELDRRRLTVEIPSATRIPLPLLLRRADLHLTHSSSVAFEAWSWGLRTVLTSKSGSQPFAALLRAGACEIAEDAGSLVEALRRGLQAPRSQPSAPPSGPEAGLDLLLGKG